MALVKETVIFSESEWFGLLNELSLPTRQAQIVKCLFSGLNDKQIAMELHISVPTVRTYMSRLFSRFEVQDRNELILCVFGRFREHCRANGCPL
jgi:DNA-binding NarL/FixJ family response regulator